jgi:hypothetical protein
LQEKAKIWRAGPAFWVLLGILALSFFLDLWNIGQSCITQAIRKSAASSTTENCPAEWVVRQHPAEWIAAEIFYGQQPFLFREKRRYALSLLQINRIWGQF